MPAEIFAVLFNRALSKPFDWLKATVLTFLQSKSDWVNNYSDRAIGNWRA
jgi:hypothetical protein